MKKCRTCGRTHTGPHKAMRSAVKPVTQADKKLSVKHLKDSVDYNKRHIADHKKVEKKGGSKKYNEAHIKGHEKAMEKDEKLIQERMKDLGKRQRGSDGEKSIVGYRAKKKLLRAMKGYRR